MNPQLLFAALAGIAAIVVLITWAKLHPFLSLTVGAGVMAALAGVPFAKTFDSFGKGFGSTMSSVGLLIALGAIIGTLLVASGGADAIVDKILASTPVARIPWAMALVAFVVGIPLFFEVGVVILIPVVMFAARKAQAPVVLFGIPALAGLSALHGLVPPHPGPLIAIDALKANLGLTLGLGLLVAIPCVVISGPVLGRVMARWVPIPAPETFTQSATRMETTRRPGFGSALVVVLLPVVLMLLRTLVEVTGSAKTPAGAVLDFVGAPLTALLITTFVALGLLGLGLGVDRAALNQIVGTSFGPIAGILLIVGAGGGFKQTLVDSGIGKMIAEGLVAASLSPLVAGWLVAVLIRLATG